MNLHNTYNLISKTEKRSEGFKLMMDALVTVPSPLIVETGCVRQESGFSDDGMSTLIFDSYIHERGEGELISVDISQENVDLAREMVKNPSSIYCSDSIPFLLELNKHCKERNKFVDLLYLDSYDFNPYNTHPSALHHMYELCAILPSLRPGSIIVVDDNFQYVGKGLYIKKFMEHLNKPRIYFGYQWMWTW